MSWDTTFMGVISSGLSEFREGEWRFKETEISVPVWYWPLRINLHCNYNGTNKYEVPLNMNPWGGFVVKVAVDTSFWILALLKRPGFRGEEIECMAGVEGETLVPINGLVKWIDAKASGGASVQFGAAVQGEAGQPVDLIVTDIGLQTILETALGHGLPVECFYYKQGDFNRLVSVRLSSLDSHGED